MRERKSMRKRKNRHRKNRNDGLYGWKRKIMREIRKKKGRMMYKMKRIRKMKDRVRGRWIVYRNRHSEITVWRRQRRRTKKTR